MKKFTLKYVAGIALLLLLAVQLSNAQTTMGGQTAGTTLDKVEITSIPRQDTVKAGDEAQFAIVMDIKDGWHLNAHKPPLDYLIGVDLSMDASNYAMVSNTEYPAAKQRQFSFANEMLDVYEGKVAILLTVKTSADIQSDTYHLPGTLTVQACSDKACLAPSKVEVNLPLTIGKQTVTADHETLFQKLENRSSSDNSDNSIASLFDNNNSLFAFLSIFLIGLALNLTPCVYPMISVTVSLFGGQQSDDSKSATTASAFSRALVYMLGIVFMYSVLGVIAAFTGGLFGSWMQSPWVLAIIGLLILLLSLSMFGLYELQPPSWVMQKLNKTQQASGYVGHFLSGLLVGIFAAPCIGPPIIALLAFVGAKGSPVFGFFAFFVMALGLGIPYLILGTFSGLLNKMPKSGLWMVWVKKVFGVVLVGVGLFYMALAFAPGYSMYAVLATVVLGGIYLGFIESSANGKTIFRWVKYTLGAAALVVGFLLFQNLQKKGLQWQDYDANVIQQKEQPVMLDFYADWCIPCIELDRKTFTDSRVINEADSFLRFKVDLTHFDSKQAEELREQYDIAGVPTIVFLDSEGNELENTRVVGFMNADDFLKKMNKAKKLMPSNE